MAMEVEDHPNRPPDLIRAMKYTSPPHSTSSLAQPISTRLRNEINRKLSVLDVVSCMEWNAPTAMALMTNELSNFGLDCLPSDLVIAGVLRKCTDPAIMAPCALATHDLLTAAPLLVVVYITVSM